MLVTLGFFGTFAYEDSISIFVGVIYQVLKVTVSYWLFKSEPDCFSIDDLAKSPKQTATWDGVRNYRARNILRDEVKLADAVFFYYSSSDPLGIAGICSVVREGYPDATAWNPKSEHYDPKSSRQKPVWYTVDLKFVRKFKQLVTLAELKSLPALQNMMVTQRGARLSIQPVTVGEWQAIIEYEKKRTAT